ncbi:sigma-70 family RNA polymerase sigma factor [Streptomyces sp. TG1A-8]|uniref:sigma-70 family RNA polymerase sigma factor n=1 Tax=Streptomyces sp. TG1A-8 TaxID=3051385 RepID=UPI00265C2AFC|nr:sigma-70 family RNA polymerase sigma factor [Streptomyces sp. TG1A-8]MDO0924020.1 sigma-70 family RNA polymerase sigma factor [Streptomyces sp. TG1A-8]
MTSLRSEQDVRAAYRRYGSELFGFACNALDDRQLAEEVVQETFLRAWRSAPSYDEHRSGVRTWLYAIARNVVADARRRRSARPPLAGHEPERDGRPGPGDGSGDPFDKLLLRIELDEALQRLSPDQRQVITDVYLLGRSCADLAAELGIPAATVRSRLYYGVRALRGILEENGWLAP